MENPTILYVEDDLESREIMRVLVEEVMQLTSLTIFENSQDFMKKVGEMPKKPDIFLLDIHMTPHTGFEMLKFLRDSGDYEGIPIIALTASVMNEEVQRLKTSGFDGVLAKPLDMDAFPDALQRILKGEAVWYVTG